MECSVSFFVLSCVSIVFCSICDRHPGVHPYECCKIPPLYDEEAMSECRVQYRDLEAMKIGSVNCFVLCGLRAANASTYLPNTIESFANVVTQNFDAQLANVVKNAIHICMNSTTIIKGTVGLTTKMASEGYICDPNALLIKGCIAIETFINCPSSRANNSTSCGTLRRYLNECRAY